jgi:hypothetical protein
MWLATSGTEPGMDVGSSSGKTGAQPTAALSPSTAVGGVAAAIALFPSDDPAADTSREVLVDPDGQWPAGPCLPATDEPGRTAFVSGTEHGPEYQRQLAVGWYADDASATAAYDALAAGLTDCAGAPTDSTTSAPSGLGSAGQVIVRAVPAGDGWAEVSTAALTRDGPVLMLVVETATYAAESIPAPAEATSAIDQADRLLDEVCRVDAARC